MDREPEELQFLGFLGIFREAYNIIFSWKKILSQITLALIFPLSAILLAHTQVSNLVLGKILRNEVALQNTWSGSPTYDQISNRLSSEWITFWLFKVVYLLFIIVFSLLSTSACVYTIACIYTAKDITFKKVMSVVPKVWKRLMITFLCKFSIMFAYSLISILVFALWVVAFGTGSLGVAGLVILVIVYLIGFTYMNIMWVLANIVSVLEDARGVQALIKSKELIKGKRWIVVAIFFSFQLFSSINQIGFQKLVVNGETFGVASQFFSEVVCFMLLSILILLQLVVETIVYFVCKSYHHESIDKSCLADHLEVYLGEYVPLKTKDVQLMEQV